MAGEVQLVMAPAPRLVLTLVRAAVLLQRLLHLQPVLPPDGVPLLVAAGLG